MVLSSRGLGHRPVTAGTGVRIPLGLPYISQLSLTRKVEWGVEVERTCRTAYTHIHRDTSWLIYGIFWKCRRNGMAGDCKSSDLVTVGSIPTTSTNIQTCSWEVCDTMGT